MDSGKEPRDDLFLDALKKKYQVYIESPDNAQGEIDIFLVLNKNDKSTPNYSNYNTNYMNSLNKNVDSERLIKYMQSPNDILIANTNNAVLNNNDISSSYNNTLKTFEGINGIRSLMNKNQHLTNMNNQNLSSSNIPNNLNISNFDNPYSFSMNHGLNHNLNIQNPTLNNHYYNYNNPYESHNIQKNINLFDYAEINSSNISQNVNKSINKDSFSNTNEYIDNKNKKK